MKRPIRIILITLLIILIIIQFIRPAKNISSVSSPTDIAVGYKIPDDVQHILKVSCYDCHSNNTVYPWYWQIQPVTWFMNGHIDDAKRSLNFSTFSAYSIRKQYRSFDEINKEVKDDDMPLNSYTLIHRDAKLSEAQKLSIATWTTAARKEIEANYPADSLKNNKPPKAI